MAQVCVFLVANPICINLSLVGRQTCAIFICLQVVNVSAATVHARTGLPDGTSPYELIIRVNIIHNSLIYTYSSQPATVILL
jgi:hypothetical protein